jgi:hypothetical protein
MECNAMDRCGFVNLWCFHAGCKLTTPDPSALILSVKFCDQDTGTNLHHKKEKKDSQRSKCLPVLFGAICHVLVFVMFLLAANLSLPELVLVRTYTL